MGLGALRRVAALRQNEPENRTRSVVRYGPFAGRAPRSPQRRPAEKPRSGPPAGALSWAWPKVPCFWTAAVPCYRCFRRQLGAHRMATARASIAKYRDSLPFYCRFIPEPPPLRITQPFCGMMLVQGVTGPGKDRFRHVDA